MLLSAVGADGRCLIGSDEDRPANLGAFTPDLKNGMDIFGLRGIDRERGAMVVVRPDQYVANVVPLHAFEALADFFGRFLLEQH